MNRFSTRRVFACLNAMLLTCMILVFVTSANAQYTTSTGTPTFTTALPVEMGFTNVANGNLHLEIPIASFPQRGSLAYNARLVYDSLIWKISSNTWQPTNVPNSMGGWRLITGGEPGTVTNVAGTSFCDTPPPLNNRTFHVAFVWSSPDGTSHRFPIFTQHDTTICAEDTSSGSAMADDSSGYFMSVTGYTNATVYAPDGTQVFPTVMDTNGNFMSVSSGDIIDTLGRKLITTTTTPPNTVKYAVISPIGTVNPLTVTVTTTNVPVNTAFGQTGISECSTSCSITPIQSIVFSDGTTSYSYSFTYDSGTTSGHYGVLTGMTLTTGGTITYDYTTFVDGIGNHSRWLSKKTAGSNVWEYTPLSIDSSSQKVTVKDCLSNTMIYNFSLDNGAWMSSVTYHDNVLGDLLTTTSNWDMSNSCPSSSNCRGAAFVRKLSSTTLFPSGLSKTDTYTYASSLTGQLNEIDESDYYNSGGTPPISRKTFLTYASLTNTVSKPSQITVKDGSGNIFSQTNYTYDQGGTTPTGAMQHSSVTGSRGNLTTVTQLVSGTNTLSTTFTYDDAGNVLTNTDPAGNVVSFDYTDNFNGGPLSGTHAYLTKITLPTTGSVTHVTQEKYDGNTGLPVTKTDLNGNQTNYTYDFLRRPISMTTPDGGQTSFSYPSALSITQSEKITATQTMSVTNILDAFGRATQKQLTSDPDGTIYIDTAYDGDGHVTSVSNPHRTVPTTPPSPPDPTDGTTFFAYDALGRVTKQTQQDGNVILITYSDNCATTVDEASKHHKTCTDGLGRTNNTFEPDTGISLGWETDTAYDALGNIVQITQKGGSTSGSDWRVRSFSYDGLSRMTQAITPEAGTTSYVYTTTSGGQCAGNLGVPCKISDARGVSATLTYDALSRLTGKSYSDSTHSVTYNYDQTAIGALTITNSNGLRTSMTDGSGSTAWSFDLMGRTLIRQQTISTVTKSIGYTYNLDGSVATMTSPSSRVYTYTYNNAGQASSLKDVAHSINFFSGSHYAPPGMLSSGINGAVTGWNAITLTNSYNNRLQLSQAQAVSPLPLTLLNLSYSYDQGSGINNGNIMSITNGRDSSRSVSYSYDQLNRLASAQSPSTWGNSYSYDAWGNLTQKNVIKGMAESMSLIINNKNQVTSPAFTYDSAGEVTWDTTHALSYDAEGHMSPASGLSYTYDGDGRRVLKSDGTVYWIDDQLRPIAIGTTSGSITRDYVFLGSQRIAMVPISSGNPYYYLSDHLGSTAVIASGDGKTIQWDADYFPFGTVRQVFTGIVGNSYEFTGYENDSETGYNNANARYESGRWGAFLAPDPFAGSMNITNPQSLNRYAYVTNNPISSIDPLGLAPQSINCPLDIFGQCGIPDGQGGIMSCTGDGMAIPCGGVPGLLGSGGAVVCPNGNCGSLQFDKGKGQWEVWTESGGGTVCNDNGCHVETNGHWMAINFIYLPTNNEPGWWSVFFHDLVHNFSLTKGARNQGETFSDCMSRAQTSLLGNHGAAALDAVSGVSALGWVYTTPLSTVPGPVPGVSMGKMSSWELDAFANNAVDRGFAFANKAAPAASKATGIITAIALGVKGGFVVACMH